jgi:hypothetical protein
LIQKPARAAAVKDGRHADLSACSAASRPRLDGREHDGTLVRHGSARSPSSPLPINWSARKHIKIRDPAYYALANAGHDTRSLQAYLGHRNIQHTVRYTELSPTRFRDFWR